MWTKLECYRPRHCCQVDNNEKWQCSCVANSSPIQPPIRVHILPTVLSTLRLSPWFWQLKIEITNILQWCFTQTNPIQWKKWWISKLPTCTRHDQLWIRLSPELAGFLINCWVFGLIWKAWLSSLIWCMAAWCPTRSDWVTDQNVESFCPGQAQLRKQKKFSKFDVVLSVLNQWHLLQFCVSY